jgi:hypothetical protein
MVVVQTTPYSFKGSSTYGAESSPHVLLLVAADTNATYLLNLNGSNWQSASNSNLTFSLFVQVQGPENNVTKYYFAANYLTDPQCPAAVGQHFFEASINSSGIITSNPFMTLCTPAS